MNELLPQYSGTQLLNIVNRSHPQVAELAKRFGALVDEHKGLQAEVKAFEKVEDQLYYGQELVEELIGLFNGGGEAGEILKAIDKAIDNSPFEV
jgi:hypothetical protein